MPPNDLWSRIRRGRLVQLGEPDHPRDAYEFVTHWAQADPELQPMAEDARTRLARLATENR